MRRSWGDSFRFCFVSVAFYGLFLVESFFFFAFLAALYLFGSSRKNLLGYVRTVSPFLVLYVCVGSYIN